MAKQPDLRSSLDFSRDALDDALEGHAGLVLRAGDEYAYAISRRDEDKAEMEAEYARACDRARRSEDKKTESMVKEQAQQDSKYLAAETKYLNSKMEADLAASVKDSFEARGKAIGHMAQLFVSGYFAVSAVKGEAGRQVNAEAAKASRAMLHSARLAKGKVT